jgi:hypothetical protein
VAKKVFIDQDTGTIYRMDPRALTFVPHECNVRGSELPTRVYVGKWFNRRTQRTRWIGPFRMRKSAENPPKDNKTRHGHDEWKLDETYVAENIHWRKAD